MRAPWGIYVADSLGTRVVAAGDGVVAAVGCDPTAYRTAIRSVVWGVWEYRSVRLLLRYVA